MNMQLGIISPRDLLQYGRPVWVKHGKQMYNPILSIVDPTRAIIAGGSLSQQENW